MTNSMSRRLHIQHVLVYNVQYYSVFITSLFALLYVRIDNLLPHGKHLHDAIISVSGDE